MRPAPTTMGVVIVVVPWGDGRYVFVEEAKDICRGQWALPGGVIERGEGLAAAIVREVREEAGITVEPTGVFRIEQLIDPGAVASGGIYEQKFRFVCAARPLDRALKTAPDAESLSAAVLTVAEARRLTMRDPVYLDLLAQVDAGAVLLPMSQVDFQHLGP